MSRTRLAGQHPLLLCREQRCDGVGQGTIAFGNLAAVVAGSVPTFDGVAAVDTGVETRFIYGVTELVNMGGIRLCHTCYGMSPYAHEPSGTVTNRYAQATIGNVTTTNNVCVSFGTDAGDSGGPVYWSYPGSGFVEASGITSYMWGTIQGSFTQPFANKGCFVPQRDVEYVSGWMTNSN